STQLCKSANPLSAIRSEDHFRVGFRREAGTPAFEARAQFPVVVDFAVEHNHQTAIVIPQRLLSGFQIDDRQPRLRKSGGVDDYLALAIGPAVTQRRLQTTERTLDFLRVRMTKELTADTAHLGACGSRSDLLNRLNHEGCDVTGVG